MARNNRNQDIILIDEQENNSQSHPVLVAFMVLVVLGILSVAVWFFGFSQWGFSWSGNTARQLTEAPESVVTYYPTVELSLDQASVMLEPGETARLKAKATPSRANRDLDLSNVSLKWVSQNPRVASIDSHGNISALSVGTATIVLTVANSDIDANPAYCLVTVRSWGRGPLDKDEDTAESTLPSKEISLSQPTASAPKTTNTPQHTASTERAQAKPSPASDATVVNVSALTGTSKVFGGAGVFRKGQARIDMTGTKTFIIDDGSRHAITLRDGDYITDVQISRDGTLTAGTFHYGSATLRAKGLKIKL